MNSSFDQKLKCAIDLCEGEFIDQKFINIYPFTTENISGYLNKFDLNNKSLLTVGSSGDQVINAVMNNCKDISVVDICPFTKFYFYLKKAAILSLTYEEFLEYFCYRNFYPHLKDNYNVFSKNIFEKFKQTLRLLDYESYLFWDELFSCYDNITIRKEMFEYDEDNLSTLKQMNLYMNDESKYISCKNKIKNINPKFITGDIKNIKLDKKHDNIWLSNIGQYLEIKELKSIAENLFKNLNDEGKFLLCYLYQTREDTEYNEAWAKVYNLNEVYKEFKDYILELNSFIGIRGIMWKNKELKDSVLLLKK